MALSSEYCDNSSCGIEEKILFLATIYAVFSPPTDVEMLWFHPSWQLSMTQLLAHSSSIPRGVGGPLILLLHPAWGGPGQKGLGEGSQ